MNIHWHRLFIRLCGVDEKRYRQLPNEASVERSGFLSYLTGHKSKAFPLFSQDLLFYTFLFYYQNTLYRGRSDFQEVDPVRELSEGKHTQLSVRKPVLKPSASTLLWLDRDWTSQTH